MAKHGSGLGELRLHETGDRTSVRGVRQQPPGSAPECDAQTCSRFERKRVRRAPGEVSCQSDRILI
jgi:hypothetical protein